MIQEGFIVFTETGMPPLSDEKGPDFVQVKTEELRYLHMFARNSPHVKTALHTLGSSVIGGGIVISKEGQAVHKEIKILVETYWLSFLTDMMEQLTLYGFALVNVNRSSLTPYHFDLHSFNIYHRKTYAGNHEFFLQPANSGAFLGTGFSLDDSGSDSSGKRKRKSVAPSSDTGTEVPGKRVKGAKSKKKGKKKNKGDPSGDDAGYPDEYSTREEKQTKKPTPSESFNTMMKDVVVFITHPPDFNGNVQTPLVSVNSLYGFFNSAMGADMRARQRGAVPSILAEVREEKKSGANVASVVDADFPHQRIAPVLQGYGPPEEKIERYMARTFESFSSSVEPTIAQPTPFYEYDWTRNRIYYPEEPQQSSTFAPVIQLPKHLSAATAPQAQRTGDITLIMEQVAKEIFAVLGVPWFIFGSGKSAVAHNQMVVGVYHQNCRKWRTLLATMCKKLFIMAFRDQFLQDAKRLKKTLKLKGKRANELIIREVCEIDISFPSLIDLNIIEALFKTGLMDAENSVDKLAEYFQVSTKEIHKEPSFLDKVQRQQFEEQRQALLAKKQTGVSDLMRKSNSTLQGSLQMEGSKSSDFA